jgi:transposase InsO family protein
MESCFGTLKTELEMTEYSTSAIAVRELGEYTRHYNTDRRHSSLGYVSPAEFELTHQPSPPPQIVRWTVHAN